MHRASCLSLVVSFVGVASQGVVDPSSAALAAAGTSYDSFGAGNHAVDQRPTLFDPMAAANPQPTLSQFNDPVAQSVSDAIHAGTLPGLGKNAPAQMAAAPGESGDFLEGLFAGYFEKITLLPGEKTCFRDNIRKLGEDGAAVSTELIASIGSLLAQEQPNWMMLAGGARQVVEMVTSAKSLVQGCVEPDTLIVMNITLQHLRNATYVKGRLLANGVDIAKVLSDAVPAVAKNDYERVGRDFGTLLRKILLSKNSGALKMVLPPGQQPDEVGPTVANGIIEGLFAEGTNVTITDALDPSVDMFVDLHACIAKEAKYYRIAMNAMYLAIAQIATNLEQWELQQKGISTAMIAQPSQEDWMGQLSGVMYNIPKLMQRCGINNEQRMMMSRAIKSMDTVSMAFGIPGPTNKTEAGVLAAKKFEVAADAWKVGEYSKFGKLLGSIMRDLLLVVYPRQYHIDKSGKLRAFVDKQTLLGRFDDVLHNPASNLPLLFGTMTSFTIIGLALFRLVRLRNQPFGSLPEPQTFNPADVEACWDDSDMAVE